MTKAQEIQALTTFVASLPQDSYLRDWLAGVVNEVQSDIRGDIFPSASISEAQRQVERALVEANADAERIRNKASQVAKRVVEQAESDARQIRSRLRQQAYDCYQSLSTLNPCV